MKFAVAALLLIAGPAVVHSLEPGDRSMRAGPGSATAHRERPAPFAAMSPAGRRAVIGAMRPEGGRDNPDRQRVRAARNRVLQLLSADRLDVVALRRTMDEEREAAEAMHNRRQAALLQALQGLSLADRRAFVADATSMRGRFEGRLGQARDRLRGRGGLDDGPPGPPPF